jgi:hypothetical protein
MLQTNSPVGKASNILNFICAKYFNLESGPRYSPVIFAQTKNGRFQTFSPSKATKLHQNFRLNFPTKYSPKIVAKISP